MRLKKKYLPLFSLVLWIVLVPLFFKMIPERKLAATLAGLGFFVIPISYLYFRRSKSEADGGNFRVHNKKILGLSAWRWIQVGFLQFWLLFAIPIFFSRILFWNEDFQSFRFFGFFTADDWHHYSSRSYLLMLLFGLVFEYLDHKESKKRLKN